MGMIPQRLTLPTVGLIAASMVAFAGERIEPEVSVPTFPAQKLMAVPMPELDPGNHLSYMLQWFAFGIMIIIAVVISARRERKAAAEAVEHGAAAENDMVVIDKAALDEEAAP